MATEGGIFIDILTRLNMASIDRVLKDAKLMMKEAGTTAGESFNTALDSSIAAGAKTTFDPLVAASDAAFRDMQIGMANLQAKEAELNALRATNWRKTTDAMIAAQKEVDAAVANTQRLMADATAKNAAIRDGLMLAGPGGGRSAPQEERQPIDNGRAAAAGAFGGRVARGVGAGSALALAGMAAYGVRADSRIQNNLQQLSALQGESAGNVGMINQAVWQQAVDTGYNTNDISKLYPEIERANNPRTGGRYRGQDAITIGGTSLRLARIANIDPDVALQGLTTSMSNYGVGPQGATGIANLIAQGLAGFKGNATDYFEAQHTIEPIASMAGIKAPEVFAALDIMSQRGQSAQQSAIAGRSLMSSLANPSGPMSSALQQMGLNPQDLSVYLNQNGLAGTLSQITQAVAQHQFGDNGSVVLGALANKPLMEQQQQTVADQLSPEARQYMETDDFQKSLVSGFSARKILEKAGSEGLAPTDMPLLQTWLQQQQKIMGVSDVIRNNKPMEANLLGALTPLFGTKEGAQAAIMLGGSPEALQAYKGQEQNLSGAQNNPNSFTDAFKTAMDTNVNQWHVLGEDLGRLSASIGNDLLPVIKDVTDGLTGMLSWLDQHKSAEQALVNILLSIAAAWGGSKIVNMFDGMIQANAKVAAAANTLAGAEETTATKVATMGTEAETAGAEMAEAGIGGALKGAAANIAGAFAPAALAAIIGQQVAGQADQWVADNVPGGNWFETHTPGDLGKAARGAVNDFATPPATPPSGPGFRPTPGRALGGMIDQPLMGQPDTGGDSILGMVGGSPVGLRGGEGILTPDAVARIGGKPGVDALNSGTSNPWSDPFKVGTSFYNSFAQGVAKYSPFGKYLTATGQTLDSLEKQHEDLQKEQMQESKNDANFMIDYLQSVYGKDFIGSSSKSGSLQDILGLGTSGKTSVYRAPKDTKIYGGSSSNKVTGGSPDVMSAIDAAGAAMGLSESQLGDVKWIMQRESGFDPNISNGGGHGAPSNNKAFGLGQFLGHMGDKYGAMGAYSGDPYKESLAAIQYMKDAYGSPAGAKAFWQSHNAYAKGGIVGYAGGGTTPDSRDSTSYLPIDESNEAWWLSEPGWNAHKMWQYTGGRPNNDTGMMRPGQGNDPNGVGPRGIERHDFPRSSPVFQQTFGFAGGGVLPMAPPPPGPAPGPRPGGVGGAVGLPVNKPNPHTQPGPLGGPNTLPGMPGAPKPPKKSGTKQSSVHGDIPGPSMIPGGTAPPQDRNIKDNPSQQLTAEGKGFGAGGGLLGAAESAASMAADAFAPGSGQAASMLFALANRGIGYAGQLVGIGMKGLMETFLPNDSAAADPSKNIFGKMALGIAGAHPSGKNWAGSHSQALDTKKDLDAGAAQAKQQPGIHVNGDIHNHTGDHQETFNAINKAVNFGSQAGWFAGI